MKILHVIDDMNMGGAQSLLVELAPAQVRLGHEVRVLELALSTDETLTGRLKAMGVRIDSLSSTRSCRNLYNIIALIPYIKSYDIVHVHLFPANYWVALAKLISFSKVPIVTTEHSTDNKRRHSRLFRFMDSLIYRRYQEVVACSNKAQETFALVYKGVNLSVVPNGVNLRRYISARSYDRVELFHIPRETFVSTMVARFNYPKRQDVLLRAVASLPENFHCAFVGGSKRDSGLMKIKEMAEGLGIMSRTHFLYTRSDVPEILKSSDVIVMASEYEGLSLSSIEGMACGKPFVASDVNGLKEVVEGAGELFECEDYKGLAEIILNLSKDNEYRGSVVLKCLKRASEYDIDNTAAQYISIYQKYNRRI